MPATFDPTTGTVTFPKGTVSTVDPSTLVYVAFQKDTIGKLAQLGKKDGADLDAPTAKGRQAKATRVAKVYIDGAISALLNKRSK